jgi:hypothetical protein
MINAWLTIRSGVKSYQNIPENVPFNQHLIKLSRAACVEKDGFHKKFKTIFARKKKVDFLSYFSEMPAIINCSLS